MVLLSVAPLPPVPTQVASPRDTSWVWALGSRVPPAQLVAFLKQTDMLKEKMTVSPMRGPVQVRPGESLLWPAPSRTLEPWAWAAF